MSNKLLMYVYIFLAFTDRYIVMARPVKLKTYKSKRTFATTPEPTGNKVISAAHLEHPLFVVQLHKASHLHYDVRLEIEGVMPSWAVPKGPSMDPSVKRLAVPTEDHPLDYATFEGVIPQGNYGAGTVMVWDIGSYEHMTQVKGKKIAIADAYHNGIIEVFFKGSKLQGTFTFIRLSRTRDGKPAWLLIKKRDAYASGTPFASASRTRSVLTGRTLGQITKESSNESR